MPSYLQKRAYRWYAVMEIPKPLRDQFGKPRFVQSLETESLTVAERRKLPILAEWRQEIAKAKNEPVDDDASYWLRRLRHAKGEKRRNVVLSHIEDAAWEIGAVSVENIGESPTSSPEARDFVARATGQRESFDAHLDEWISTSRATAKTQDMQRSDVKRFAAEFKSINDVSRREVRRWVSKLMNEGELTPKTVQRILSALRGYWRYLQSIEVADEDDEPFSNLDVARQNKRIPNHAARRPFEPEEVLALLEVATAREDDILADLIRLGMWTGCRIEELCALRTESVKDGYFSVTDAKTAAGWRDVPIHAQLAQTMTRLIDDSKDGYVLSGLTENKYGDRSNAIGKRFGRLKADQGFGPEYVFHSIRKTVITILENAGVPENVVADIVGHEKPTMTYGLYSGGLSLEVKTVALARLQYETAASSSNS